MSFALLAASVVLGTFAGVTALGSLVARALAARVGDGPPARSARRLFALRTLPSLLGLVSACGVALPAFVLYEPRGSLEAPGSTFVLFAAAGAVAIAAGFRRAVRDWWTTRRLRRDWTRKGAPLALAGAPAPAYRIRHPFPVVTVVGILRPRLFVAEQVIERLSGTELAAVLAHERGHVSARDNLKRIALRLAPALWAPEARRLEERWEQAAEEAADDGGGLELASALVKTARLASAGARIDVPAAAFHRGGVLARRVRRLTEARPSVPAPPRSRGALSWIVLAVAVALAGSLVSLAPVHALIERVVHLP